MSFDRLAPHYRALEFVLAGRSLQDCRLRHLEAVAECQNALLLGEGPGRFLLPFLQRNRGAKITCVESSACMISEAKRHAARLGSEAGRVRFEQADARLWKPTGTGYDLVVTCFFLDCFPYDSLRELITRTTQSTSPSAVWLVADFRLAETGWRRHRAKAILWLMYRCFRIVTKLPAGQLTNPDGLLKRAGFSLEARYVSNFGLLHSDLWRRAIHHPPGEHSPGSSGVRPPPPTN